MIAAHATMLLCDRDTGRPAITLGGRQIEMLRETLTRCSDQPWAHSSASRDLTAIRAIARGEAAPTSIVAVSQRHLDFGGETERRCRLADRAGRRSQHASIGAQLTAQSLEGLGGGSLKRFVVGEPGPARRRRRAMCKQVEPR